MTDRLTPPQRSANMAAIRGRDTRPEIIVRRSLHAAGFRYRLHARNLPGRPDIVLPRHRAVILVHGCFWHQHPGCREAAKPKTREEFWREKFEGNSRRDARQIKALLAQHWRVLIVWECALRKASRRAASVASVIRWMGASPQHFQIPRRPYLSSSVKSTVQKLAMTA